MWLFTPYGFYSAVSAGPYQICVRARLKSHLTNLLKRFPQPIPPQITSSKTTDYRYRIIVDQVDWKQWCYELAEEIDYPNFKARVAEGEPDEDYLDMLHEVWQTGYDMQRLDGMVGKSQRRRGK